MKKIGFITCDDHPGLYYDDQHLIEPFAKEGIEIIPVIWDKVVDFSGLDLLVFRSAWDYHFKTKKFEEYLENLKQISIPVCNPISIIQGNYDKYYLKALQSNGFPIIPTLFFENVGQIDLQQIMQEKNWQKGVVKPVISMSAYHTYSFDEKNVMELQKNLKRYYGCTKVMVQKFADEIITEGEWSIIFYDKQYCMSALKKPKQGDFRVQGELGGTLEYRDPPTKIIAEAKTILDSYSEPILYARMDGIIQNGHFQLMEAELIDPELYFRVGEKGQDFFLKAIKERIC